MSFNGSIVSTNLLSETYTNPTTIGEDSASDSGNIFANTLNLVKIGDFVMASIWVNMNNTPAVSIGNWTCIPSSFQPTYEHIYRTAEENDAYNTHFITYSVNSSGVLTVRCSSFSGTAQNFSTGAGSGVNLHLCFTYYLK